MQWLDSYASLFNLKNTTTKKNQFHKFLFNITSNICIVILLIKPTIK